MELSNIIPLVDFAGTLVVVVAFTNVIGKVANVLIGQMEKQKEREMERWKLILELCRKMPPDSH